MFVYTFWEPRENIPLYLQLCMETWKKFLPNATIVVLDYKNIGEFIDVRELGLSLFSDRRFNFLHIADAIRVALLAKHGGVWLDVDTIILSSNVQKYFLPEANHKTIFFGNPATRTAHVAFINTPPAAMCMNLWHQFNREKLRRLNPAMPVNWDFFSNSFINDYAKKYPDELKIVDANLAMPEKKLIPELKTSGAAYLEYYFLQNHHLADVNAEMLLLHNSWSPPFFKQLSKQDFFRLDCTMVNVLAEALNIKLPPRIVLESNSGADKILRASRRTGWEAFSLQKLARMLYFARLFLRSGTNGDEIFTRRGNVRSFIALGVRNSAVDRRREFGSGRGRAVHNRELFADENISGF